MNIAQGGEHAIADTARVRAIQPPSQQHRLEQRRHRDVAGAGRGFGEFRDRAVHLLHSLNADHTRRRSRCHARATPIARSDARQSGTGRRNRCPWVRPLGGLKNSANLAGREDRLLRLGPPRPIRVGIGGTEHWYIQAGIEQKFFALGKTTIYGEYGNYEAGSGLNASTTAAATFIGGVGAGAPSFLTNNEVQRGASASCRTSRLRRWTCTSATVSSRVKRQRSRRLRGDTTKIELEDFKAVRAGAIIRF